MSDASDISENRWNEGYQKLVREPQNIEHLEQMVQHALSKLGVTIPYSGPVSHLREVLQTLLYCILQHRAGNLRIFANLPKAISRGLEQKICGKISPMKIEPTMEELFECRLSIAHLRQKIEQGQVPITQQDIARILVAYAILTGEILAPPSPDMMHIPSGLLPELCHIQGGMPQITVETVRRLEEEAEQLHYDADLSSRTADVNQFVSKAKTRAELVNSGLEFFRLVSDGYAQIQSQYERLLRAHPKQPCDAIIDSEDWDILLRITLDHISHSRADSCISALRDMGRILYDLSARKTGSHPPTARCYALWRPGVTQDIPELEPKKALTTLSSLQKSFPIVPQEPITHLGNPLYITPAQAINLTTIILATKDWTESNTPLMNKHMSRKGGGQVRSALGKYLWRPLYQDATLLANAFGGWISNAESHTVPIIIDELIEVCRSIDYMMSIRAKFGAKIDRWARKSKPKTALTVETDAERLDIDLPPLQFIKNLFIHRSRHIQEHWDNSIFFVQSYSPLIIMFFREIMTIYNMRNAKCMGEADFALRYPGGALSSPICEQQQRWVFVFLERCRHHCPINLPLNSGEYVNHVALNLETFLEKSYHGQTVTDEDFYRALYYCSLVDNVLTYLGEDAPSRAYGVFPTKDAIEKLIQKYDIGGLDAEDLIGFVWHLKQAIMAVRIELKTLK